MKFFKKKEKIPPKLYWNVGVITSHVKVTLRFNHQREQLDAFRKVYLDVARDKIVTVIDSRGFELSFLSEDYEYHYHYSERGR